LAGVTSVKATDQRGNKPHFISINDRQPCRTCGNEMDSAQRIQGDRTTWVGGTVHPPRPHPDFVEPTSFTDGGGNRCESIGLKTKNLQGNRSNRQKSIQLDGINGLDRWGARPAGRRIRGRRKAAEETRVL